jgi:hypothetical protein
MLISTFMEIVVYATDQLVQIAREELLQNRAFALP